MSAGHSTALSRSLRLCRNEWMTQSLGTRGFNHLFNAALAELALDLVSLQYFGKANWWPCLKTCFAAQRDAPTSGICLELEPVFSRRQRCAVRLICGISPSRQISDVSKPQASYRRMPVSLISAISHLGSSSNCIQRWRNWSMKIYHNAKTRSLKWIIFFSLLVGIGYLTIELLSLSLQFLDKFVFGCLENQECFFDFWRYLIEQSDQWFAVLSQFTGNQSKNCSEQNPKEWII